MENGNNIEKTEVGEWQGLRVFTPMLANLMLKSVSFLENGHGTTSIKVEVILDICPGTVKSQTV